MGVKAFEKMKDQEAGLTSPLFAVFCFLSFY
jgi:hypothetical protein